MITEIVIVAFVMIVLIAGEYTERGSNDVDGGREFLSFFSSFYEDGGSNKNGDGLVEVKGKGRIQEGDVLLDRELRLQGSKQKRQTDERDNPHPSS